METALIYITSYENIMTEVSEDFHSLRGDLQGVHTRCVEEVDPNMQGIIGNATTGKRCHRNIEFVKI